MSDMIHFDGDTIDQERDGPRLQRQLNAVRKHMEGNEWLSLRQIADELKYPEASISARLRDLRKERYGARHVERRYRGEGLFEYKLHPKQDENNV
jgi:biotin operon repressor